MAQLTTSAKEKLVALLDELFTPSELRRFLRLGEQGESVERALVGELATREQLVDSAVEALENRGLVNRAFFIRLRAERPGQEARIAAAWRDTFSEPPDWPPIERVDAPSPGGGAGRTWGIAMGAVLSLGAAAWGVYYVTKPQDLDGDSYVADDCAPRDASVHPGAEDACNGKDDDCDAATDEDAAPSAWYPDADGDGYGVALGVLTACERPAGYASVVGDDFAPTSPLRHPGAPEVSNGLDDDGDGAVDEGLTPDASHPIGGVLDPKPESNSAPPDPKPKEETPTPPVKVTTVVETPPPSTCAVPAAPVKSPAKTCSRCGSCPDGQFDKTSVAFVQIASDQASARLNVNGLSRTVGSWLAVDAGSLSITPSCSGCSAVPTDEQKGIPRRLTVSAWSTHELRYSFATQAWSGS